LWARAPSAAFLVVAAAVACADPMEERAFDGDPVPVYVEALRTVFDSIGLPAEDLVFPDRFIGFGPTDEIEPATPGVPLALAERYPRSRVCDRPDCGAVPGETMVLVSRVRAEGPDQAEVAVNTWTYAEGNVFGDGFEMRLAYDGGSWRVLDLRRIVIE
jgi:hypothetical protein